MIVLGAADGSREESHSQIAMRFLGSMGRERNSPPPTPGKVPIT